MLNGVNLFVERDWKTVVVMMPALSPQAAPGVVITTTSSATCGVKVGIMTIVIFSGDVVWDILRSLKSL